MNLSSIVPILKSKFRSVPFEVKENTGDKLRVMADISINDLADNVLLSITCYKGGTLHVFLTFDEISETMEVYRLINDLNENCSFYKAYVSKGDTNYLEIHATSICAADENEVADTIEFFMTEVLEDRMRKYLLPLVERTY